MRIIACALLFFCFCLANAQDRFKPIEGWLKENSSRLGGRAVILVYKDGKIVYNKTYNARLSAIAQLDEYSVQPIASCSKWLSAALVMSFVDEGKLNVDDTVGKFLPVLTANGKGQITIAQCLSHQTGIKQAGPGESDEARIGRLSKWPSMKAAIDSIAKMPVEGEPGKTFHYGNAGLQIAAAVIEKISGKNFETLFQERIAGPCGMTSTGFGKGVPLAAGGARGTAMDYLHFLQMILDKGMYNGRRVLSEKSIAGMQLNHAKNARVVYSPAAGAGWGYGFGEWVMKESVMVSSPGLFGSFPWVNNEKGYCAILFTVNLRNRERAELYKGLVEVVEECL